MTTAADRPDQSWLGATIDVRTLFAPEQAALMATLRALPPAAWAYDAVPGWTVHDLAAHLLGDFYGRLARDRDDHVGGAGPAAGEAIAPFIHRLNQEWVDAFRRVSPTLLMDTLDLVGSQLVRFFEATDPHRASSIDVSWAGADPAPMWLDSARDFSEFWTHRQQIRRATGQATDPDQRSWSAVLDTFMRALPHTLRDVSAPSGTQVHVRVEGPSGGRWTVTATAAGWSLAEPAVATPAATLVLDAETAWRLCTRGIQPDAALSVAQVDGARDLAEAAAQIVSIIY